MIVEGVPEVVILRFFKRMRRYMAIQKVNEGGFVPDLIINNEKNLITRSKEELKKFGIDDTDEFFQRPAVQVEYLVSCENDRMDDEYYIMGFF